MLKKLTLFIAVTASLMFFAAPSLVLADAQQDVQCGVNGAAGVNGCTATPDSTSSLNTTIKNIINILSVVVGVVAVVMVIVAGFRYITSAGDTNKVASAKNTLIFALIGLAIVALAQVIAQFVLTNATSDTTGNSGVSQGGANSPH